MSDATASAKGGPSRLMEFVKQPLVVALVLIVALLALGEFLSPGFASAQQILRLLIVAALLGIVAAGQNLVILGGREGIDLSVGGVVSLSAVIAGNLMNGVDSGIPLALLACVGIGALFGLFNGIGVTLLRIPPLVMTLGMLGVLQGLLVGLAPVDVLEVQREAVRRRMGAHLEPALQRGPEEFLDRRLAADHRAPVHRFQQAAAQFRERGPQVVPDEAGAGLLDGGEHVQSAPVDVHDAPVMVDGAEAVGQAFEHVFHARVGHAQGFARFLQFARGRGRGSSGLRGGMPQLVALVVHRTPPHEITADGAGASLSVGSEGRGALPVGSKSIIVLGSARATGVPHKMDGHVRPRRVMSRTSILAQPGRFVAHLWAIVQVRTGSGCATLSRACWSWSSS